MSNSLPLCTEEPLSLISPLIDFLPDNSEKIREKSLH